jgi:hypothetical protein
MACYGDSFTFLLLQNSTHTYELDIWNSIDRGNVDDFSVECHAVFLARWRQVEHKVDQVIQCLLRLWVSLCQLAHGLNISLNQMLKALTGVVLINGH